MEQNSFVRKFQNSIYAQSIRHGLTLAIPFLIMGSFSLLLRNFPIEGYQVFLNSCFHGAIIVLLETLFNISLGSLALVLSISISISYGILAKADQFMLYPITAVLSYLAFCGGIQSQKEYIFNAEWVFTAMCLTLLSCILYQRILKFSSRFEKLHTTGAEYLFNLSIQSILPVISITVFFALTGLLLRTAFGNSNITNFGSYLFLKLFQGLTGNIFGILLYVIVTHLLWFIGIHGTNTLEAVANGLFEHNIEINHSLLLAGKAPTEIFSKTFLDTFAFSGGCGCAISFVLAMCIASKKSHNQKMSWVALPVSIFNISEVAVFGFPIIFNFTMLIPFILTPVILTLISTLATITGLVPFVTQSVEWTVPIFLNGYQATGSIAGSILQLINVVIGIFIYMPFIRKSEQNETEKFRQAVHQMEQDMSSGEKNGIIPKFLHPHYCHYHYAKTLSMDLQNAIKRRQLQLFYQAQISDQEKIHGIEALLRWKHPIAGYIAPPVIISLAYEDGLMDELSSYVMNTAWTDAKALEAYIKDDICLSVNLSPKQIRGNDFFKNTLALIQTYNLNNIHPVLEITEREALEISEYQKKDMVYLKENGISFSLDDFGMGHNSILQLQEGIFDEVKLDGQLVSQLLANSRSREIISTIIQMAQKLNCRVVAEYVETKDQRDALLTLGCVIYQGYYYSRPLDITEFIDVFCQPPAL